MSYSRVGGGGGGSKTAGPHISTSGISSSSSSSSGSLLLEELRECSLRPLLSRTIGEPSFAVGRLALSTSTSTEDPRGPVDPRSGNQRGSAADALKDGGGNLVTVEYRLASFEYRLLPEMVSSSPAPAPARRSPSTVTLK